MKKRSGGSVRLRWNLLKISGRIADWRSVSNGGNWMLLWAVINCCNTPAINGDRVRACSLALSLSLSSLSSSRWSVMKARRWHANNAHCVIYARRARAQLPVSRPVKGWINCADTEYELREYANYRAVEQISEAKRVHTSHFFFDRDIQSSQWCAFRFGNRKIPLLRAACYLCWCIMYMNINFFL
jgi:hypothetical protein